MSGDTFEFDDRNHAERFVGTLHDPAATPGNVLTVQPDKSIAAQPGGGSTPISRASYSMGGTVAAGTIADAAWGNHLGDALLDLTVPTAPVIAAAGIYALSCSFGAFPHSAPGPTDVFAGALNLDPSGLDPVLGGSSYVIFQWLLNTIDPAVLAPQRPASITGYIPATTGPVLEIGANNSAVDIDYEINVLLQRLA